MSHDSGFRRGGQDFTHKAPPRRPNSSPRSQPNDRSAERRFHKHERDVDSRRDKGGDA